MKRKYSVDALVDGLASRNEGALARILTLMESSPRSRSAISQRISDYCGSAHVIGITGPPGAGKSTITAALTALLREQDRKVGIIAYDPSSPFSGGSVLGDRIRMRDHVLDDGVFIRSLSNRGVPGGISSSAKIAADLMDAFGLGSIIIETVGVGQTDLNVMRVADTVLVVLVPESGDSIQVMKSGLMEIGDVFAVNKSDRLGADRLVHALETSFKDSEVTIPSVVKTRADTNEGIHELLEILDQRFRTMGANGSLEIERRSSRVGYMYDAVAEIITGKIRDLVDVEDLRSDSKILNIIDGVQCGSNDPFDSAMKIVDLLLTENQLYK